MTMKILCLVLTSFVLVNCLSTYRNEDEARWMNDGLRKYTKQHEEPGRFTRMSQSTQDGREQGYEQGQDMRNTGMYQDKQIGYFSSQEQVGSFEIRYAQKHFHDTDPEAAGNGRLVVNQIQSRSHKVRDEVENSQDELMNKIYKDMQ